MGVLGDALRAGALEVDRVEAELSVERATVAALEATVAAQAATISGLEARLADCEGDPGPGPQPVDGVLVELGDDINAAIRQHPAGTTFALEAGVRVLSEPLVRKAGNRLWSDGVMFTGPGAGGVPFLPVDVSGLVLQGIGAKYFGPANSEASAGMVDFAGGTDLLLEDCDFGYSNRSIVSGHKSWSTIRCHFHHGGKWSVQGALGLIEDCEWSYSGRSDIPGVTPWTSSSDKGGCKFVKSNGVQIERLWTHHHGGTGLWWDIQNVNGYAENVVSEDNARHGISIEVSYGPFELVDPIVRRCGTIKGAKETNVPVPAGILVSLTPDVVVSNPIVEDCYNGLVVRQWDHPQSLPAGHPDRVGNTDRTRLGCENIIFQGGSVTRSKQFDAGLHGPEQPGLRPTRNVHWNDVTFDADASFCSALHFN